MRRPTTAVFLAVLTSLGACGGNPATRVEPAPRLAPSPDVPAADPGPREQTADEQVNHVLSRLTFGARPGDAEAVRAMGVDRWIALQLHPERIPDERSDQYFAALESYHTSPSDLQAEYPAAGAAASAARRQGRPLQAHRGRQRRAAPGGRPAPGRSPSRRRADGSTGPCSRSGSCRKCMTDFWLNHFSVYPQKGPPERYQLAEYESQVIRPNALGKFRTLLDAVAKSPAMLFYLDNWESQADSNRPRLAAAARDGARRPQPRGAALLTPQQRQALAQAERRAQRELRPRAAGAAHARRGRRLHAAGRDRRRARAHRLDASTSAAGRRASSSARRCTTPARRSCSATAPGGPRDRGRRGGARHPRAPPVDGALHRLQARAPVRERHAARRARRSRGRDLPANRRRHPGSGAHDRHEPGVLLARRVPQQGEGAVRARGQRAARAWRPAGRHAAHGPASSRRSASRFSGTRRPTGGPRPATSG